MANRYGPKIINDGLVLCIDAAGDNKSYPIDGLDVEYLVVGGGGAGGFRLGGGGGAGGLLTGATKVTIATGTYPIVVGAGGASITTDTGTPSNGSNSSFAGFSAVGGGGGGQYLSSYAAAGNGGSGGGASSNSGAVRGAGTTNQGYAGGYGSRNNITSNLPTGWSTDNGYSSGGGGGAGLVGTNGVGISINAIPGDGGIGKYLGDKYSNGLGENGWFAGGGGGQQYRNSSINAAGGLGGGGRGAGGGYGAGQIQYNTPTNAQANTGGGGGGGGHYPGEGGSSGSGGSGIVLIRYSGPPRAKGGDSIISHNGYTIHVFNSSGNFIVGETVSDLSRTKTYATLTNMNSGDYTRGAYWSFDGSNQRLLVPHNSLQPYDLSYESVIFLNTLPCTTPGMAGCYRSIWQKSVDWNGTTGISLQFIYGYLRFSYGQTWAGAAYYNQSNFQANKYYHIVGTSSSTSSGTMKLYVNGVLVSTGAGGTPTTTNPLWIGYGSAGGINGRIPLFKSYSIELSQEQILNNFNAIRGRYGI